MIQSIYTLVSNADTTMHKKPGTLIKSDPIPLLKDKFLSEYRTELEKAKVRKNLGIPDENNLEWGNISGFVEQQSDLVEYVESKWNYTTSLNENVTNIKDAMDYALYFVTNFKGEHDSVLQIQENIKSITDELELITESIKQQDENIIKINSNIDLINKLIDELNQKLLNINVDSNILTWVTSKLQNSNTIELTDDSLELKISISENNAISLENGLFVTDLSKDVKQNSDNISALLQNISDLGTYTTLLTNDTTVPIQVGGILSGTTVESLKGKTINQIIDSILFPTFVRDLIYPSVYYTLINTLVEVGSSINRPTLIFEKGDAGLELNRTDELTFNGEVINSSTYDMLGTYVYNGSVTYDNGEYLIDNKGNTTSIRVEGSTYNTSLYVITTYPWYIGDLKQELIQFGIESGILNFSASGQPVIKLPGGNTQLLQFQVDGGLGYLDIDLTGWTESSDTINGIPYKIWTKNDIYPSVFPHRINFKLEM